MKLSKHLDIGEVIRSESAKREGIINMPTPEHYENLKVIAEKVFEPIREHFGVPIFISSGYRSEALNVYIGGSRSSDHSKGRALDLDMDGSSSGVTNKMIFEFIKDNLEYDQLINEFDFGWVHVGYRLNANRKQTLRATKVNGKTTYSPY
jgi:zinc D-Ala-D-Ala carboxypeptidase